MHLMHNYSANVKLCVSAVGCMLSIKHQYHEHDQLTGCGERLRHNLKSVEFKG